jgi:hypothetical protein
LLLSSALIAADFWTSADYGEWTSEQVMTILSKSPWASVQTVRQKEFEADALPQNSRDPGCCDSDPQATSVPNLTLEGGAKASQAPVSRPGTVRHFVVRFQTALPTRMAQARMQVLGGRMTAGQAEEYLNDTPEEHIIVAIWTPPEEDLAELNQLVDRVPEEHLYLSLKKSGRKIPAVRVITPFQAGGREAYIVFPRITEGHGPIGVEEKQVHVVCVVNEGLKIEAKFPLKKMVFGGKLEL